MDRCYVFRFILDTLAGQHFREVDPETPLAEAAQIQHIYEEREVAHPAHTCVDQPILPCPACLKWTGDGFATVRANPQCFPAIALPPTFESDVTSVIASCAKTKINRPQQGNSLVERRTQNMTQLPSLNAAPPIEPPEPPKTPKSITASRNSALVVEQNESLMAFFLRSLQDRGYAVRTARDAEEGLRLYRDCAPFSVVLINYFVPRKRGTGIDCFAPQTHWAELAMSISNINRSQSIIIAALDYRSEDEVQRPTELSHVPLLTDTSELRLQKLLERLEVERAIQALTKAELLQLQKFAAFRIRGLGRAARDRTGADLLNEAMLSTLIGAGVTREGRRWNQKIGFVLHLRGTMRSMSSYWKRKFDEREAYLEAEILEMPSVEGRNVSPLDNAPSDMATTEEDLIAKEKEDRIFQLFKNDFEATAVLRGFADGLRKNEVTQRYGFTESQYQAALRRIRVKLSLGKNGRNGGGNHGR